MLREQPAPGSVSRIADISEVPQVDHCRRIVAI
jgi:hypothetical protein